MLTAEYYTTYYRLDDFDLKMISLGGEENEMSFSRSLKSFFFLTDLTFVFDQCIYSFKNYFLFYSFGLYFIT